eukprot:CAMPEP_0185830994 /NCGR_PEP_ID=MMETSP1353-20130828/1213_1 /TAXON_ID=1077150 /ORGANISM="Erythrolobus australicus, Strain CCMP3124" /LENGTH=312 /DNA_ID=CAMNT_0028528999 /DNA_START=271 /DNA_END=1209 /DNA_ORIENTATION=+
MKAKSYVLLACVAALSAFGLATSTPIVQGAARLLSHKTCSLTEDFAADNYEACPVHNPAFNILGSCNSIKATVPFAASIDCSKLESQCELALGCCDYKATLFGTGSSVASEDQSDFVSDFVGLCQQTKYDSAAALDANHIAIASGAGDNSVNMSQCYTVFSGSTTEGDYCLKKRKFMHAVKRLGNHIVDVVPRTEVAQWMTELLIEATDYDVSSTANHLLCLDPEEAKNAGVAVATLIETYAPAQQSLVLAQLDPCCHPMCYNLFDSARGTKLETLMGSASESFELIARQCCDVVRVTDPTCPSSSLLMLGY